MSRVLLLPSLKSSPKQMLERKYIQHVPHPTGVLLFILLGLHPFQRKWQNEPYTPKGGAAPFGGSWLHSHSQTCSLSWLHSTRALVWGGINATQLNVSSEWHSPGKAGGMLCHGMGCELPGHQKTTKPLQLSSCRNVLLEGKGKGGGRTGTLRWEPEFENLSKQTSGTFLFLMFQKLEEKM